MTEALPALAIDRRAAVRRVAFGDHSWVDVVEGFVRDHVRELTELVETTSWTQTETLRYDRYIPEQRLGAGIRSETRAMLRQAELHLEATYRVTYSGVAAMLYRTGADHQGLHSDRSMRWLDETLVAIVVLGQRRPFVVRRRVPLAEVIEKVPAGDDPDDVVLMPGEGDLIVMGGAMQRDYMHGVPRFDTPDPRISLTWRWTSRRGRPDTNPGFYDGKHFSDGPSQPGSRRRRV